MSARPYVQLYISPRSRPKLVEWQAILRRYGIDVRGIGYPNPNTTETTLRDAEERLRSGDHPGRLGILYDVSDLVLPGTTTSAPRQHLQAVEHYSHVQFFWREGDEVRREVYEGRAAGYLDLREGNGDGWWDDQFRMQESSETLTEWKRRTGSKVSARDATVAQFIAARVRSSIRDFNFFGIVPGRPVSFDKLVLDDLDTDAFTGRATVREFGLYGLLQHVANMGIHFRAPVDRRGSVAWDPGLHGGIPTTPKKDAFHEKGYFIHDVGHQPLSRGMFEGTVSELLRRVDLVQNMLSEAFTMVLADMAFVDAVRASGYDYDYTKRRIWPLFEATGLSGAPIPHDRLLELLLANGHYCVTGKTETWEGLISGPKAGPALARFTESYQHFFRADLVWNAANWRDRVARKDEFRRWWELVGQINRANGLGLQTLPEIAKASGAMETDSTEALVEKIGRYLFRTRLLPVLQKAPKPATPQQRLHRAFARWMSGQLLVHVRYDFIPEVRAEGILLTDALCRSEIRSQADLQRLRDFFERRVDRLAERGLLPHADAEMYREMVPHVEPKFVGYVQVQETHREAARRLLDGRTDDREPGVGILIRNRDTGQCILQQKDHLHPHSDIRGRKCLWGGSIELGEEPEDALPRELDEELANTLLTAEIAGQCRYRRRFRLSADPWPGEYDLYVFEAAVDNETFIRWLQDFAQPGMVKEGMAVVVDQEEIDQLLAYPTSFLCSHGEVLTALRPAAV